MKCKYNINQIAWLFIYIFAFGISDMYVRKYLTTPTRKISYYVIFGIIGLFILYMM